MSMDSILWFQGQELRFPCQSEGCLLLLTGKTRIIWKGERSLIQYGLIKPLRKKKSFNETVLISCEEYFAQVGRQEKKKQKTGHLHEISFLKGLFLLSPRSLEENMNSHVAQFWGIAQCIRRQEKITEVKLPPLENVRGFLKKDCEANFLKAWKVGGW